MPRGSGRIEKACFFPTKACFFLGKHAFYGDRAQTQCLSPVFSVPKPEKHAYLPSKTEKACFFPIESMLFVGGVGIRGPKACFIRQIVPKPRIFGAFCPKSALYVNKMGQLFIREMPETACIRVIYALLSDYSLAKHA